MTACAKVALGGLALRQIGANGVHHPLNTADS